MGVVEWLRKRFRITKRELIIGIVLATVIGVVIPPLGLMMLAFVIVGLLMAIFGSDNATKLVIAWWAMKTAERISKRFAPPEELGPLVRGDRGDRPALTEPRGVRGSTHRSAEMDGLLGC